MLSKTDRAIIDFLQSNGRMTQADIARSLGVAPSAVLERIRKLEARGVIRGYVALLDPKAVEQPLLAFVAVKTNSLHGDELVGQQLSDLPEVLEVHHVAGEDCYLLKVRARDTDHLGELLRRRLGAMPEVTSTRTTIVLGTLKETPRLALPPEQETTRDPHA